MQNGNEQLWVSTMDYNFQRAINALTPRYSQHSLPKLSSSPATTLSNPGLSNLIHLYPLYVPIHNHKNIAYEIKKQVESKESNNEQVGEGQSVNKEADNRPKTDVKKDEDIDNSFEEKASKTEISPNDKSKEMNPGVEFAFKHPAITTDKLIFVRPRAKKQIIEQRKPSVPAKKLKMSETNIKHKFQFS